LTRKVKAKEKNNTAMGTNLLLQQQGIFANKNKWIKSQNYLPLYTLRVQQKESIKKFYGLINFDHPVKRKKLNTLLS